MRSILSAAANIAIMLGCIILCFRLLGVMMVNEDATIYLDKEVCPVHLNSEGFCSIKGSYSHTLAGDVEINSGKSVMIVSDKTVKMVMFSGDAATHFRPFGKYFAFAFLCFMLVASAVASFGVGWLLKGPKKAG